MKLVIVESPTKAKTISQFLGKDFTVLSSYGHLRDLPKKKLGIDVDNNFEPEYVVPDTAKKAVDEIKKKAAKADSIILAADEDREGEAIAWHIAKILNLGEKDYERIAFHEITKKAIEESLKHPRKIDIDRVDAQQARRILDRLVGYKLSPFLWKKVARGLSAGRVQSVTVRLIVEREEEIKAFKPEEHWDIFGLFKKNETEFTADLYSIKNERVKKFDINNKEKAEKIRKDIDGQKFQITNIEKKETKRHPTPPFTTSTLQQASSTNLHYSSKQTMMIAQQLYEGIKINNKQVGLITYMRTDSLNLSDEFLANTKKFILDSFGEKYDISSPRRFKTKSKGAQEAHEAIRPTHPDHDPETIKNSLTSQQYRLYSLIWKRAIASQMTEALFDTTRADITSENKYTFKAKGVTLKFDGFLKVYGAKSIKEEILPELEDKEPINLEKLNTDQKFTEPPARYSEATLIKALEEAGIGRPSTYAPTISTVQARNYVIKNDDRKLQPTEMGTIVTNLLVKHFPDIVDPGFTAEMEEDLDAIADEGKKWQPIIKNFYEPFIANIKKKEKEVDKKEITEEESDEICEKCGKKMIIKLGRFGKFYACSGYPECKTTKPLEEEKEEINEKCEECGSPMQIKHGRFGKFMGCSAYPKCKNLKSFSKKIGMKCPDCEKGDIVEKRTKRKRLFYGCSEYPKCEYASWKNPTIENESKKEEK